jgi:hypothetical protein
MRFKDLKMKSFQLRKAKLDLDTIKVEEFVGLLQVCELPIFLLVVIVE